MENFQYIKTDAADNIHANIDGEKYIFATSEFYGGKSIYGVCFPNETSFTFINRSKKAKKIYEKHKADIHLFL